MISVDALDGVFAGLGVAILGYFILLNSTYILITLAALVDVRSHMDRQRYRPLASRKGNPFAPGVAVVVPAYNEANVIVESVQALLTLEYPRYEVLVVNDGSTDGTLDRLLEAFDLQEVDAEYPLELPCEPVNAVYRAPEEEVTVIDKANGGKSDALNAGLFFTERELFCAIDADAIIEHGSLYDAVEPFLEHPTRTVATGGAVRVANGCSVRDGVVTEVSIPRSRLVTMQIVEYLRAFLAGRIGLSRLNSLLIISGAFGLFRADVLREIGGYDTDSITEDMEIVVRLHRHLLETGEPYDVTFLPEPVVWTEVPSTRGQLAKQRRRWFRGLLYTLSQHRDAIGRRQYGVVGLFALPFFIIIEALGPLVEGAGYVFVPVLMLLGMVHVPFFTAFLAGAILLGAVLSGLGVFLEVYSYRRYERPSDIARLLGYGIVEAFVYRPWKALQSWIALVEFIRGDTHWGEMVREGFATEE